MTIDQTQALGALILKLVFTAIIWLSLASAWYGIISERIAGMMPLLITVTILMIALTVFIWHF